MENFINSKKVPLARNEVEIMTPYSAPLEGRRKFLRLDFNENTIGPSPKVLEALHTIQSEDISIYPEYHGLKEAIIKNLISSKIKLSYLALQHKGCNSQMLVLWLRICCFDRHMHKI